MVAQSMSQNEPDADSVDDAYPWRNESLLRELYIEREMTSYEIGDRLGCDKSTVLDWMQKFDIPARSPHSFADEIHDEDTLREMYVERGMTTTEIGAEVGCHSRCVSTWLRKHGIEARPTQPKADKIHDEDALRNMYVERGMSTTEIGEVVDCNSTTVSRWLERHDIEARPAGVPAHPYLADEERLRIMYEGNGYTMRGIADRLGCGMASVGRWMNKHGIEREQHIPPTGPDNPHFKGGRYSLDYGAGWTTNKKRARERDGNQCQACGRTNAENIEKYGRVLEVHHIRPARGFDDAEERNRLDNLVTVCRGCHQRWEGIPLKPQLID